MSFLLLMLFIGSATADSWIGQVANNSPPPVVDEANDPASDRLANLLPEADDEVRQRALSEISQAKDARYIAPLIDLLRFADRQEDYAALLETLHILIGEKIAPGTSLDPWEALVSWYGEHAEWQPPPGYTGWKGELHAQLIDDRFRDLLYPEAPSSVRVEEVVWGGVRVDGIPALVNPKMRSAKQADYLIDSEPVFGVGINGDYRAYPLRILDWHEMANDVVGGQSVALAYCTLCGSGVLYDTTVKGKTYVFGSSGFLFRSNKLMYDRQTQTLWNQLTGEPVIGKLVGSAIKLKVLPVVVTSWGEWQRQHPTTKVVDIDTGHDRPYRVGATYGRYFGSPDTMFPVWRQSKALAKKARIFAIQVDDRAKAYPLDALNKANGVVNDTLGAQALVVVYRDAVGNVPLPNTWRAALRGGPDTEVSLANDLSLTAARAVLDKQPKLLNEMSAEFLLAMPTEARLTLLAERSSDEREGAEAAEGFFSPDLRNEVAQRGLIGETRAFARGDHTFRATSSRDELIDERGRKWRVTEESLVSYTGERLPRLGGHLAYWFGWFSFYPKTEIYTVAK